MNIRMNTCFCNNVVYSWCALDAFIAIRSGMPHGSRQGGGGRVNVLDFYLCDAYLLA